MSREGQRRVTLPPHPQHDDTCTVDATDVQDQAGTGGAVLLALLLGSRPDHRYAAELAAARVAARPPLQQKGASLPCSSLGIPELRQRGWRDGAPRMRCTFLDDGICGCTHPDGDVA